MAFERVLRRRGWGRDGRRVEGEGGGGLKGALLILVDKNKGAVTASGEEIERSCEGVLEKVVRQMRVGGGDGERMMRGR